MVTRPILRYHGGKWKLAPWIIANMPSHRVYVEPFGGGGSVLLRKQRSYAEVYNDKWDMVVNVFRVLRDRESAEELARLLTLTPFSRVEFEGCGDVDIEAISDPIERARRTIFRSQAGFGSAASNARYSTGFRSNSNRSGTTPAQDWINYPAHVRTYVERLSGVIIEHRDAAGVMRQHDGEQTLHFVDPPYVHDTRNMQHAAYAHELTDQDHVALAAALHGLSGMVLLAGYPSALYEELYRLDASRL